MKNNNKLKFYFCPKCHKRVIPPSFLMTANIKSENGINIKCGDTKCKGQIKIKLKHNQEDELQDIRNNS